MEVYIELIILLYALSFFLPKDTRKGRKWIISIMCVALYLIYILRSYTVGVDIEGYCAAYNKFDKINIADTTSTYLERGYVFIMQICNTLGFTFRGFMAILYVVLLGPLALFFKRYSRDLNLSFLIFICFQFFVFTISGIRQSLAIGLCIFAFLIAQRKGIKPLLCYVLIIIAACNIHQSSIVFFPTYWIIRTQLNKKLLFIYFIGATIGAFIRRPLNAYMIATELSPYEIQDNLTIGSTFVLMLIATGYVIYNRDKECFRSDLNIVAYPNRSKHEYIKLSMSSFVNMMIICLLILLTFSGTIMMRASLYYEIALMVLVPGIISSLKEGQAILFKVAISVVLILIFVVTVLLPNQFDIVPYIFADTLEFFK